MSAGQYALVACTVLGLLAWAVARSSLVCGIVVGYAHGRVSRQMGDPAATVIITAMAHGVDVRAVAAAGQPRPSLGSRIGVWVTRLAVRRIVRVAGVDAVTSMVALLGAGGSIARAVARRDDDSLPPAPPES